VVLHTVGSVAQRSVRPSRLVEVAQHRLYAFKTLGEVVEAGVRATCRRLSGIRRF
jgi:hypothetical protein